MAETHTEQSQQQAELQKQLWSIANDLRGNMDASEFRNYILGLIFYRFLSDRVQSYANSLLDNDELTFMQAYSDEEMKSDLKDEVTKTIGFFIEPQYLFDTLIEAIKAGNFDIEQLQTAVNEVQNSTIGHESEDDFRGLFEDMDLNSSRLGSTVARRGELMAKVMLNLADIPFSNGDVQIDVLGDAYEYLISQFAASAGKKSRRILYTTASVKIIITISYVTSIRS